MFLKFFPLKGNKTAKTHQPEISQWYEIPRVHICILPFFIYFFVCFTLIWFFQASPDYSAFKPIRGVPSDILSNYAGDQSTKMGYVTVPLAAGGNENPVVW